MREEYPESLLSGKLSGGEEWEEEEEEGHEAESVQLELSRNGRSIGINSGGPDGIPCTKQTPE